MKIYNLFYVIINNDDGTGQDIYLQGSYSDKLKLLEDFLELRSTLNKPCIYYTVSSTDDFTRQQELLRSDKLTFQWGHGEILLGSRLVSRLSVNKNFKKCKIFDYNKFLKDQDGDRGDHEQKKTKIIYHLYCYNNYPKISYIGSSESILNLDNHKKKLKIIDKENKGNKDIKHYYIIKCPLNKYKPIDLYLFKHDNKGLSIIPLSNRDLKETIQNIKNMYVFISRDFGLKNKNKGNIKVPTDIYKKIKEYVL